MEQFQELKAEVAKLTQKVNGLTEENRAIKQHLMLFAQFSDQVSKFMMAMNIEAGGQPPKPTLEVVRR